jgi:hypothetical protein
MESWSDTDQRDYGDECQPRASAAPHTTLDPGWTAVPSVPGTIELLGNCFDALQELCALGEPLGPWLVTQTGNPFWLTLPDEVEKNLKEWGWPWETEA